MTTEVHCEKCGFSRYFYGPGTRRGLQIANHDGRLAFARVNEDLSYDATMHTVDVSEIIVADYLASREEAGLPPIKPRRCHFISESKIQRMARESLARKAASKEARA